jgi:chromosomal replication initiation ATPase DnaA
MMACFKFSWNDHIPRKLRKNVSDLQIIEIVKLAIKLALDLDFEQYDIKLRERELVFARSCFCTLIKRETNMSLKNIGKIFKHNYDHSTIIHNMTNIHDIEFLKGKDARIIQWQNVNKQYNKIKKWK